MPRQEDGWLCPSCGKAHAPNIQTCPSAEIRQRAASEPPMVRRVGAPHTTRTPAAPGWMPPVAGDTVRFGVEGRPLPIVSR